MNYVSLTFVVAVASCLILVANAQYEDKRCKCICPGLEAVNGTNYERKQYIGNAAQDQCKCEIVVIPQVINEIKGKEREFCTQCECKYESRNTTTIRVVVILIIWVVSLLVVYMLFLMCLDPILNKSRSSYQEHQNEEELNMDEHFPSSSRATDQGPRSNVFNRVGHQQDKWKRQVQEQRRNIYDQHTMLN